MLDCFYKCITLAYILLIFLNKKLSNLCVIWLISILITTYFQITEKFSNKFSDESKVISPTTPKTFEATNDIKTNQKFENKPVYK